MSDSEHDSEHNSEEEREYTPLLPRKNMVAKIRPGHLVMIKKEIVGLLPTANLTQNDIDSVIKGLMEANLIVLNSDDRIEEQYETLNRLKDLLSQKAGKRYRKSKKSKKQRKTKTKRRLSRSYK
jgi:hypothetical protein